jgi:hypothetical protein
MSIVEPLTLPQLQDFQKGLNADLTEVLNAQANAKRKLEEISSPAYLKKYTNEALAEMRQEQMEQYVRSVLNIIKSLPYRKQTIEDQREYWEVYFWPKAQLYPPPPEIKIDDTPIRVHINITSGQVAPFTVAVRIFRGRRLAK